MLLRLESNGCLTIEGTTLKHFTGLEDFMIIKDYTTIKLNTIIKDRGGIKARATFKGKATSLPTEDVFVQCKRIKLYLSNSSVL
jgi:hypothetical protein